MHVMHNKVSEINFKNHNVDHLEPLVCAKPHLPFQNHNSREVDKGRERERESFILKLQQFTGTQEIILLLLFLLLFGGTNGKNP
jgi:hypothetical protein